MWADAERGKVTGNVDKSEARIFFTKSGISFAWATNSLTCQSCVSLS